MRKSSSAIFQSMAIESSFGLMALVGLVAFNHGKASSLSFGIAVIVTIIGLFVIGTWPTTDYFWQRLKLEAGASRLQHKWLQRYHRSGWISCFLLLIFAFLWVSQNSDIGLIRPFGLLVFAQALLTLLCGAMIFVSAIKIKAWRSWLMPFSLVIEALFLGGGLLTFVATCFGRYQVVQVIITVILGLIWVIVKSLEWHKFDKLMSSHPVLSHETHIDRENSDKRHIQRLRKRYYVFAGLAILLLLACEITPWFSALVVIAAFIAAYDERRLFDKTIKQVTGDEANLA